MTGRKRLPRAKNPQKKYAIPGKSWNRLVDQVESQNLTVSPPLAIIEQQGGTLLTVNVTPGDTIGKGQYQEMGLRMNPDNVRIWSYDHAHAMNG